MDVTFPFNSVVLFVAKNTTHSHSYHMVICIVYSKQSMYPILDYFVNTRILSVYENIDSSICQKIISSDLFSGHHNVYESDSDQIISSNVDNNNVYNKLNNLCSLEIKYDVS